MSLTGRESQIMLLVAEDMTSKEIAEKLSISYFTVEAHIRNAKQKLGARTRHGSVALICLPQGQLFLSLPESC